MDALTSFIVVIIAITIQFSLYAIKRLQEPLEPNYLIDKDSKKIKNYTGKYWKNAEITNIEKYSLINKFLVLSFFMKWRIKTSKQII